MSAVSVRLSHPQSLHGDFSSAFTMANSARMKDHRSIHSYFTFLSVDSSLSIVVFPISTPWRDIVNMIKKPNKNLDQLPHSKQNKYNAQGY